MADSLYFFVGLITGLLGTLIGAGGGFLLTPLFIFLFPDMSASRLTALSLLAVCANSTSGSIGYSFRNQVHWKSVGLFSVAAVPGVFIGVYLSRILERGTFEILFAGFLGLMSVFVIWRGFRRKSEHTRRRNFWNTRTKVLGGLVSFFVGILSSLLGIGGGIVHVPLLSEVFDYPVHLAAGTSHAILALSSLFAVFRHFQHGDLTPFESFVPFLVVGLIVGAQMGAALSKRLPGHRILTLLGLALISMAVRLIYKNL
jgi:uncharacterized membrane protein YfcA